MRKIALPIILAASLAAGAAHAQGPNGQAGGQPQQPTPEQRFQEMDTNNDGKVTRQEFLSAAEVHWTRMLSRMDTSKDSMVSKEEFLAAPKSRTQQQPR